MSLFQFDFRVRYAETDQMGVSYYANYFVWFEMGRTEYFRSLGVDYTECEKKGIYLPVVEANCRYSSPARYDERLSIEVAVSRFGKSSMKFVYRITEKETRRKIAEGYTVHAFVNTDMKPVRVPEEIRARVTLQEIDPRSK
ncbi:MAG TPA: thioesterase family protein [Candidatus Omnitrophota bacterium]|nr:thioesterase family protein [Candidatus Omnitrophota bacterium]